MPFLNESLPHFEALIRREYLYNMDPKRAGYVKGVVFGVTSIQSRALGFSVMTERGVYFDRLPVSAFVSKPCAPVPLSTLERWDCFGYDIGVLTYDYLKGLRCAVRCGDGKYRDGTYVTTIDWARSSYGENAGVAGHKSGHLISLDEGHYAVMPNTNIFWREGGFISKPHSAGDRPDYRTNTHVWMAEQPRVKARTE